MNTGRTITTILSLAVLSFILIASTSENRIFATHAGEPISTWSFSFVETAPSSDSYALDGIQTSAGNYVVAGEHVTSGQSAPWAAMLDPNGAVIWEKEIETGTFFGRFNSVSETAGGGFILAGRLNFDAYLVKLAANGNLVWERALTIGDESHAYAAIETSAGEIMMVGEHDDDYWVVKLDGSGSVLWQKRFSRDGTPNFEAARYIVETADNGFVIAGSSGIPFKPWIFKIDGTGNIQWQKILTFGSASLSLRGMVQVSGGNLVFAAGFFNTITGDDDLLIIKSDPSGSILWQKSIDVSGDDYADGLAVDENGDLLLSGNIGVEFEERTAWLARLDSAGELLSEHAYRAGVEVNFSAVTSAADGGIFAVGSSGSSGGIWAIKTDAAGLIDDCTSIFETFGTSGAGPVVTVENTAVAPVTTTAVVSDPATNLTDVDLDLEVFCSTYPKELDEPYWALIFGRYTADDYEFSTASAAITNDGGVIVAGGFIPIGVGLDHAWAMKVNTDGEKVWEIALSNGEDDQYDSVVVDPANNAYLAGYSKSGGDSDGLLTKVGPNGAVIWHKMYGGGSFDRFEGIIRLAGGHLVMVGVTASSGGGASNIWLVKTDSEGNLIWEYTYGGAGIESSHAIVEAANGDLVIAGSTNSFGAGDDDAWIVRLDSNGNILWQKTYGGSQEDLAEAVIETADQDLVFAGRTENFGSGSFDAWVVRLDSDGSVLWQKAVGTQEHEHAFAVQEDSSGSLVLAGYVNHPIITNTNQDGWLFALDAGGNQIWESALGGMGTESLNDLAIDQEGNLIAAGESTSPNLGEFTNRALIIKTDATGIICDCLAQPDFSTTTGNSNAVVQNSTGARQTAASVAAVHTIGVLSVPLETNAVCRVIPLGGPTATPSPTGSTATPTPTKTVTPTATATPGEPDFLLYLPVILKQP